jgi:hypothetical protein
MGAMAWLKSFLFLKEKPLYLSIPGVLTRCKVTGASKL